MMVLSNCTIPAYPDFPRLVAEKNIRADLRDQISFRTEWIGPEKTWHQNCLYGKPIKDIAGGEQQLVLPIADLMFRAYWEEQRQAYRSAGALYRQAADRGLPIAFSKMGYLLAEGKGVPANPQGGAKLLHQSAKLDCAEGQYLYADLITRGRGVKSDLLQAYAYAKVASDQGYEEATVLLGRINSLLGPSQRIVAQQNAITLRKQLDLFNDSGRVQELVNCQTDRSPTPFVTQFRACIVMEGRATQF